MLALRHQRRLSGRCLRRWLVRGSWVDGQFCNCDVRTLTEQGLQALCQILVVFALQHVGDRAALEGFAFARQPVGGRSHTQPHAAFGTGERDIQQAHVFIDSGFGDVCVFVIFAFARCFEAAQKRHEHQRVFQTFAFVKRHHLHTMRVGFKPHFLRLGVVAVGLQLLRQILQQGLWTLQTGRGGLQQFAEL